MINKRKGDNMRYKYNLSTLEHIINDLTKLTGVAISVLDHKYHRLTTSSALNDYCTVLQKSEEQRRLCSCSDQNILAKCVTSQKLERHVCFAGLCDAAMPIMRNGAILGYIVFGRIRSSQSPLNSTYASDPEKGEYLNNLYHNLPFFTEEQLNCLYDLFTHILFEKAIEIETDSFIESATGFIDAHLNEPLNIDFLCRKLNVSRNYLYRSFHDFYGQTINDYITEQRINKAKTLLTETHEPIYIVAEKVGFDNHTYFCKLFKRKTGVSPTKYRKNASLGF